MTELLEAVPAGVPLAVLLDYDGTLVPIRQRPDLARLRQDRKALLARLSRRVLLGLISGRPLGELSRMVGVAGAAYVGNHGLEIRYRGRTWVHPPAVRRKAAVGRAAAAIIARTGGLGGVFVENKGLTASVHFRLAAPRDRALVRRIVAEEAARGRGALVVTRGKMVLEVRPNIPWDKGRGVLRLMSLAGCPPRCFPIYIGDDRTDEDAFRALAGRGLTVRVGRSPRTRAKLRLKNVEQVWEFLAALSAG